MLPLDVIQIIIKDTDNCKDRLALLSVSSHYHEMKNCLLWNNNRVSNIEKVIQLSYFNQFTVFDINNNTCGKCPTHLSVLYVPEDIFVPKLKLYQRQNLLYLHTMVIEKDLQQEKLNMLFENRDTVTSILIHKFTMEFYNIQFPKKLTELHIIKTKKNPPPRIEATYLPSTLKKFTIDYYNGYIASLPEGITHLDLGYTYNTRLDKSMLPKGLKYLKLSTVYNFIILPGDLPIGLEEIVFGDHFDQHLAMGSIPCTVKKVTFGKNFNRTFKKGDIPEGVIFLKLGNGYHKFIDIKATLPSTLQELHNRGS
jgi:hypothetical protein